MARRRRKSRTALLAERTITEIKRKEREFLKEVSGILSDALGFPVKVSHVKTYDAKGTPAMEKFRRLSKKAARRQMGDTFNAPLTDPPVKQYADFHGPGDMSDDIPF